MTNQQPVDQPDSTKIGRRNLLKAIGATGLAMAATTSLPGEWAKPVMDLGLLPAHAQASPYTPPGVSTCIPIPTPADILLTADMSGSMGGQVADVKNALTTFVDARDLSKDTIGLLSFDTASRVSLLPSTSATVIKEAINQLFAGGLTSIAYGIGAAQNLLEVGATSGNQKIIVLFSDGAANRTNLFAAGGEADPAAAAAAISAADKAKAAGIRIISVAVGMDRQSADTLMRSLASSSGDFFYVADLTQLQQALSQGCQP